MKPLTLLLLALLTGCAADMSRLMYDLAITECESREYRETEYDRVVKGEGCRDE